MTSEVDYNANFNLWSQGDKWKGFFFVVWLIIKDVPNKAFRQITNEYNQGKLVTSSRDTQELHPQAGMEVLKIFKEYASESSILDDVKQPPDNESPSKTPNIKSNHIILSTKSAEYFPAKKKCNSNSNIEKLHSTYVQN